MGTTETAPEAGGELEITELAEFDPERLDGVTAAATGIPFLIMKSVAAEPAAKASKAVVGGKVDEGPDVELGSQILALLGKAIGNEAQELAAGFDGEVCDVQLLSQAAELVRCWTQGEKTAPIDGASAKGAWQYGADEVAKAPREFTEAERKKHAAAGNALPDGSYPIPDKDALRRAAILARSGHGNVAAAKRLIARRARELGVPNPLDDDDGKSGSKKGAVAEGGTAVDTGTSEALTKSDLEAVVTKAMEPFKAELETLRAFKAKVESTAIPGGPVMSANARPMGVQAAEADDLAAKAALMRAKADAATSPSDAAGYRQYARELDEQAAKVTQA
jgi:hypothetical protein